MEITFGEKWGIDEFLPSVYPYCGFQKAEPLVLPRTRSEIPLFFAQEYPL